MPTLLVALTLAALARLSDLGHKPWELAFWLAVVAGVALWGPLPFGHWLLNVGATFGAGTAWFHGLQSTEGYGRRGLHWLLLVGGFIALIGSRLYLDLIVYGIGL